MKKLAQRLFTVCLMLVMLCSTALAETVADVDYTLEEKLVKQLEAGSGFSGTLTLEAVAVPGKESEALTTLKPMVWNCDYIYVRPDEGTQTSEESRLVLSLMDGETVLGSAEFSKQSATLYLKSTLLGENWYAIRGEQGLTQSGTATTQATDVPSTDVSVTDAQTTDAPQADVLATGALEQAMQSWIDLTIMPGLASFGVDLATQWHDTDATQWTSALDTYTTKIDLWIEGFRENAVLGKLEDGTTTMQIDYQIPASAAKAQLKQMVMDVLADTELLTKLQAVVSDTMVKQYLNPDLQSYYFYAIDQLPLSGDLTISRTVSLKGDTLALSLTLPLYDSDGKAITLSYDRKKGEGDLPDVNTVQMQSESLLLQLDYQNYDTLNGTTVYQGTFLRKPLAVKTETTALSEMPKTLSTTFTLSALQTESTDAEGLDTQAREISLTLTPEYTPDIADDEVITPTEEQQQTYVVFTPLDVKLNTAFTSGQAKIASTAVEATIVISGDEMAQIFTLAFSGKTKRKWTPDAFSTAEALSLDDMDSATMSALLSQAGIKGGLLLLPYVSLPQTIGASVLPTTDVIAATDAAVTSTPVINQTTSPSTDATAEPAMQATETPPITSTPEITAIP